MLLGKVMGSQTAGFLDDGRQQMGIAGTIIKGSARLNDTLVKTGIAVLTRTIPLGIALIEGGNFKFEVRDTLPYMIEVFSNEYSGSSQVNAPDSLIIIELKLEEKDLDNIFN